MMAVHQHHHHGRKLVSLSVCFRFLVYGGRSWRIIYPHQNNRRLQKAGEESRQAGDSNGYMYAYRPGWFFFSFVLEGYRDGIKSTEYKGNPFKSWSSPVIVDVDKIGEEMPYRAWGRLQLNHHHSTRPWMDTVNLSMMFLK